MACGAIVVSYRTGPVLQACVEALRAGDAISEIILVDNGNPAEAEAAMDALAAKEPRLRVVRGHGNVGFSAGCNLGARLARAQRLLFVNPDAVLTPEAPDQLLRALDATPGLAIIGGDLRDAQGQPDRAARRARVTLWRAFVSFTGLSRLQHWSPLLRDLHAEGDVAPMRVSAVSGALFAMRRADFEALGGFDEGYFLHVEDIDLCRRVEDAGGSVLFAPGPHGLHERSSSEVSPVDLARHKAASFGRYFRKFARTPWDRIGAEIAAGALAVLLPMRRRA